MGNNDARGFQFLPGSIDQFIDLHRCDRIKTCRWLHRKVRCWTVYNQTGQSRSFRIPPESSEGIFF